MLDFGHFLRTHKVFLEDARPQEESSSDEAGVHGLVDIAEALGLHAHTLKVSDVLAMVLGHAVVELVVPRALTTVPYLEGGALKCRVSLALSAMQRVAVLKVVTEVLVHDVLGCEIEVGGLQKLLEALFARLGPSTHGLLISLPFSNIGFGILIELEGVLVIPTFKIALVLRNLGPFVICWPVTPSSLRLAGLGIRLIVRMSVLLGRDCHLIILGI